MNNLINYFFAPQVRLPQTLTRPCRARGHRGHQRPDRGHRHLRGVVVVPLGHWRPPVGPHRHQRRLPAPIPAASTAANPLCGLLPDERVGQGERHNDRK